MEIIVPAAGASTRFPGMKPKYLLFDYKNELMLLNALKFQGPEHNIHVGILKEHDEKFHAREYIEKEAYLAGIEVNVIVLNHPTSGPAETVYKMLSQIPQSDDYEIFIKDCDSFFNHVYSEGNYVCVSGINEHEVLKKLGSKSFVKSNDQGTILDIVEKQVVSNKFCVGGYKFESAREYFRTYADMVGKGAYGGELYVSHVIREMISQGKIFSEKPVTNYVDVGTAADWHEYNDKPVIFCDIDGTLIKAQGRYGNYNYQSDPIPLQNNVNKIKELMDKGCQVIFTTARHSYYADDTYRMLSKLGLNPLGSTNSKVLFGLNNSARVLINDYNDANPYPRAVAINLKRDSDNLKDYL